MKHQIQLLLRTFALILFGCGLLFLTFQKLQWLDLQQVMMGGKYWVIFPVFLVSLMVYWFRTKRWQLLYEKLGQETEVMPLFSSLSIGYLVNIALPRVGEVSRAYSMRRLTKIPVHLSLSTIVFERLSDGLVLILLLLGTLGAELIFQPPFLLNFIDIQCIDPKDKLIVIVVFCLVLLGFFFALKRWWKPAWLWFQDLWTEFQQLLKLEKKFAFLLYTLGIWLGFYLMTFLWIYMFKESENLTMHDCFRVMMVGVVARTLPIHAGSAGAYHFAVSKAFELFGVDETVAVALAIIIHGFQMLLTICLGSLCYLWLLFQPNET